MPARPFRFGVSLLNVGSRTEWRARAREVEDLGYDVLQVPDHLGMAAPFPALVAAADVTSLTLGTFVLNAGVVSPAYLARDVADVQRLTDGRLELGLGAGYVPGEFEAVGRPMGSGGERIAKLEKTLAATRELLAGEPGVPMPPIMMSGAGDRMVALGGREADIFTFSIRAGRTPGADPADVFARRARVLRDAAGDRFPEIELNLLVAAVGDTLDGLDLTLIRQASGVPDEELTRMPGVLVGSPREIAERLERYREMFGTTYISVFEPYLAAFAEVIKHLK
ncbi:TIGR03621 family F420-dependent LLM class oxidoreductase [Amycolatopsis rhabdoformis]|uniref:TIGR03621 family F420-dependent LLM class oxidoreductase n=1 Tax=Amycolatopsis rhabdoformis TaxID=1448059 RepID=A0ABZ1IJW1_9PSEU|nr:TIGR03621 family F420-dependent LLM class oxidoreductase [Amycolatopsis rhabdoformis]WSE34784.1 TIGR03621 family F420-dependent LLM class oxidoreductase [Amycolatopsis rhabdoformis]